jgi:Flp pilus assembly pilin Flp
VPFPAWSEFSDTAQRTSCRRERREIPVQLLRRLYFLDEGQDVAEYAIMLGVVLVILLATVQLIGANANNVFSGVASKISN